MQQTDVLGLRIPTAMAELLAETTKAMMTTRAEYVRRAIFEKLERDGRQK
jgi:hypothetical protein